MLAALAAVLPLRAGAQVQREWVAFYHNSTETTNRPVAVAMDPQGNTYVAGFSEGTGTQGSVFTALKYSPTGQSLWVARHLESSQHEDRPVAMALDAQNNVYLTGCSSNAVSSGDFLTVKFDAAGNELWACRYNGPGNGPDAAKAITLDAQGNIYVTGKAYIDSTNWPTGTVLDYAYATIKYDANGNQLWVSRYANGHTEANPYGSANQDAQALALDPWGNLYVVGISVFAPDPRAPGAGFALVKYNTDGQQLAVWRYDNFGTTDGQAGRVTLALGPAGEVYVAGTMLPAFSPPPAFTVLKYEPDGTRAWVSSYYGPNPYGPGNNCVRSIAVDAAANLLLTGTSPGLNQAIDCATLKLDPQGNQLWVDRYNPATNGLTWASDLKLEPCGNAVVAGSAQDLNNNSEFLLLKYSPAGQRLWGALYATDAPGPTAAQALSLDDKYHTIVTGYVPASPGSGQIFATVAYSVPPGAITLLSNGDPKVFFPGVPGSACHIEASTNLLDWQELGVALADSDGACALEDTMQLPARFYRAAPP